MRRYSFNELELPEGGRLGLGCCPGHRLTAHAVIRGPCGFRDDLAVIAAWKPDLVLSLMEEEELANVGVPIPVLARELAALEIDWLHLPVPNFRAPDPRFETTWVELWPRLDRELRQGGRVFLHCYAGLGRTGTVASLILMQYGLSARDAIRQVRAVRPGSIETLEQEHYLSRLKR
jgi:Protein-tyrosine phosphatase